MKTSIALHDDGLLRTLTAAAVALGLASGVQTTRAQVAANFTIVNHATGQPVPGAVRNILEESSRIARVGQCLDLAQAKVEDYDALLMPGGFGVAKNHCSFAFKGAEGDVRPDVAAFLGGFFAAKKPVGAICIAPALVALALKGKADAKLTLGDDAGCAAAMAKLGHHHQATPDARGVVIDEALKLITSPAYMFGDARLSDVFVGIERCVAEVLKRV